MKKCLIIDQNNLIHISYFKEVFSKWNVSFAVCTNPENTLIKLNIEKPNLVLLSSDLEIDYKNIIKSIISKNISLIFYGEQSNQLPYSKDPHIKAFFPEPHEIDLFKLKAHFFPDEILQKEIFSENSSHIDLAINEKICMAEINGAVSWEKIHELKYRLIQLLNRQEIIGIVFIFYTIDKSDALLFENLEHLLKMTNLFQAPVQVVCVEERIKTMIKDHPDLKNIGFSNSYAEAFLKIQGKKLNPKEVGIWILKIQNNTVFEDNMYDEFGDLVKPKGTAISPLEVEELSKKGILKLYTAKDLAILGKPLDNKLNSENILINQVNAVNPLLDNKKTVLIIDDDPPTLNLLKKIVEKLSFHVIIASSGIEGFNYATDKQPDLIIVDLMMPGLNGVDLIKNYKELRGEKAAPIIVASTISMKEIVKPLLEMGVDYIIKPVKIATLVDKITKIFK